MNNLIVGKRKDLMFGCVQVNLFMVSVLVSIIIIMTIMIGIRIT